MPYWMWIGNSSTQFNATPATNLTTAEVNGIVGYTATGPNEMAAVMVNGQILGSNFQTTFNPSYGINGNDDDYPDGGPYGGSQMSYTSDTTGSASDTRITTAVSAQFRVTDLDANGDEYEVGTYTGAFIQMDNGDIFFRPQAGHADEWSDIDRIYGIEVVSTTHMADNIALNSVIGFNPDIVDLEIIPCFTAGTRIMTQHGEILIEDLRVGDLVVTKDHDAQPVRWIGRRKLNADMLAERPNLRPIRISAGALGQNVPATDLIVSPQHRVLVRSDIAQRMFGSTEVLVAAKQLLQVDGIDVAHDLAEVEYLHVLFDQHEVVISNGAETESLYTGPVALEAVGKKALAEIFEIFPELKAHDYEPVTARPLASGRMARKLAVRHIQNNRPLYLHQ